MNRRRFLAAAGAGATAGLAGCAGLFGTTYSRAPPLVEDRPDAVYIPTHSEGMRTVGTGAAGDLRIALTYSYPHRFWVIETEDGEYVANMIEIGRDDAVHLMATVWDPETGQVVPDTGLSLEITRDGDLVSEEVIYPMLSQRMGFHYGANFPLDGDGTYTVTASVGGVGLERYGAFEGRFGGAAAADVAFEFSEREREDIGYELLEDQQGQRGALRAMEMETVPVGRAPEPLPADALGSGRVGDLVLAGTVLTADRFGADPYLAVSPRTPYNRLVVPRLALSATVEREEGDGTAVEGTLEAGLDPAVGFHYGAPVEGLSTGDRVTVTVDVPPQVARHEGYETAFLETGSAELTRQ